MFIKPVPPPYDMEHWRQQPFARRMQMVCRSWAVQGYGAPLGVYLFYVLKIAFYVWAWVMFCAMSPQIEGWSDIGQWWGTPTALQKAVLWSMAFEVLGLGCGSGPLTGRYMPPFGGALYFLRPGTTKMPFWPGIPVFGGQRRTWLDVLLYAVHLGWLGYVLMAPEVTPGLLAPVVILLPLLGLTDKTLFLASRAEHYYTAVLVFCFAGSAFAGAKLVWVAVWMWAATSKLNQHFPSVVGVMISNSPVTAFVPWVRKWMFVDYPNNLRPSKLAHTMAHMGTAVELTFPLVLLFSAGGEVTMVALCVMLGFHVFITSNAPMGVPLEWNVIMVYGAFVLFGHHAQVDAIAGALQAPAMLVVVVVLVGLVPLVGNFVPSRVSFLCSMRYYAGNWPYSVWLFKGDSSAKLDKGLVKVAPRVQDQLRILYDEDTITAAISKVMAFRAMHLHGRALQLILPKAVDDIDAYEYLDGELVAGVVLGWNFGDGHLHNLQMLRAVQAQCGFEPGELRCIFVESQPMLKPQMAWTIADAADGVLEQGVVQVADLRKLDPWPALDGPLAVRKS